jgi:hypothetical protein
VPVWPAILFQVYLLFMSIRSIIQRILKEETEKPTILKIPSMKFFNNDWFLLQKFLEKKGNPLYSIKGDLDLEDSSIESLGNLESVGGSLNLYNTQIESLGNLTSVGRSLDLRDTPIESLGNLTSVGGDLYLWDTPLSINYTKKQIRKMVDVSGKIYL